MQFILPPLTESDRVHLKEEKWHMDSRYRGTGMMHERKLAKWNVIAKTADLSQHFCRAGQRL